jgi:putative ribosome biogenesis GTPase RsgA
MSEENINERIKKIESGLQKLKLDLRTRKANEEERKNQKPRVGDWVRFLNPRQGQEQVGTVTRIGTSTNYVTIDTKKGKVVRQILNIEVISKETNDGRGKRR